MVEIDFGPNNGGVISKPQKNAGLDTLGNGWVRAWAVGRAPAVGTVRFVLRGICGEFEVWVWGAQLEKGIVPTGYIPTDEEPVSRAADSVVINELAWFLPEAGTFTVEGVLPKGPAWHSANILIADDGSDRNAHRLYVNASGGVHASVVTSGEYVANGSFVGGVVGKPFKAGLSYSKEGVVFFSLGGSPYGISHSVTGLPQGIKRLVIGQYSTGTLQLNGVIGKISFFNQALETAMIEKAVR